MYGNEGNYPKFQAVKSRSVSLFQLFQRVCQGRETADPKLQWQSHPRGGPPRGHGLLNLRQERISTSGSVAPTQPYCICAVPTLTAFDYLDG